MKLLIILLKIKTHANILLHGVGHTFTCALNKKVGETTVRFRAFYTDKLSFLAKMTLKLNLKIVKERNRIIAVFVYYSYYSKDNNK